MQEEHLISSEDVDVYQYGIHLLLLKILHYCGIFIVGGLLGIGWKLLVFLGCYTTLRSYTGGYHAKSSFHCFLISIAMIVCVYFTFDAIDKIVCFIITCISVIGIILKSPQISEEKPLDPEEILRNRKISMVILCIVFTLFLITYLIDIKSLYGSIMYGLFFCSFYLFMPIGITRGRDIIQWIK